MRSEGLSDLKESAKRIIKDHITGERVLGRWWIINTPQGRKRYIQLTDKIPVIQAHASWDSEYGSLEIHNGEYFIFLNDIIVQNWAENDLLNTIIHEMLHGLFPNDTEESIRNMEKYCLKKSDIEPEKLLDELYNVKAVGLQSSENCNKGGV